MKLGEYICNLRKELNITNRDLQRTSNVSYSYISNLESGKKSNPSAKTLSKIAKGFEQFGCSYSKIIRDFSSLTGIKINNEYNHEIRTLDLGFRKQLIKDIEQAQEQLMNSYKVLEDKRKLLEEEI